MKEEGRGVGVIFVFRPQLKFRFGLRDGGTDYRISSSL